MTESRIIANRFEISDLETQLLSKGGMGSVYQGIDLQTDQAVAIKALKPEVIASRPQLVERLIREGEALRQLDHPNIVKMIATVEQEGHHYLIMEYVPGTSLRNLLDEQGALPIARALEIALELSSALAYAHLRGIVHRDLKPSNVLLAEQGRPYLTDFGVAHIAGCDRLTQTGIRVGTVNYFSPEACNGEKLDKRADIWGLGVILYEMLTGKRPFMGSSVGATAVAILTRPIPSLSRRCPGISSTLVDLVYCMLEKDRDKRIPSMRLVQEGLRLESVLVERRST